MTHRHTILVVDDEADVLRSVKDLLRLDYKVLTTTRAVEAIEILKNEEVHVVMTDQRMPEMTGVEFLHRLRGAHPDAIRLLFTGYADIHAVIDAINQGNVFRYITKPWDPEELQSIIKQACERYDLLVERRELLDELQKKNAELTTANTELQKANELKTAFMRVASHELRTPLAILLGLTGMAKNTEEGPIPPNWAKMADDAAHRLQALVDQIIKQLHANEFDRLLQRQAVNISELLRQVEEDVRPFVAKRNQKLLVDLPADLGEAQWEPYKVRDALNHLLLNAVKFTPDGGEIGLSAGGGDPVTITVRDKGMGISPEAQAQLFRPFFTEFDVSRHSSGQFGFNKRGLGLGLSIVKAFVELHGGTVRVDSTLGQGSRFILSLPRK